MLTAYFAWKFLKTQEFADVFQFRRFTENVIYRKAISSVASTLLTHWRSLQ